MKKILLGAIAATALIGAGSAFAQTCTPTSGAFTGANSNTSVAFDTCTATNQLGTNCSGLNPIGSATDAIFSIQIGPGAHSGDINLTTSTGTYDMYAGIMSGSCGAGSPCPVEADSNPAGGAEVLPIGALANGTYWLIVTSFTAGQCGNINIGLPTLPVALQNFTVE